MMEPLPVPTPPRARGSGDAPRRPAPTGLSPKEMSRAAPPVGLALVAVVCSLVSWRWHPYAVEPGVDYSAEPTTLVELPLEEVAGGTRLTVVESGFEQIPLARRAKAFEMNEGGWAAQLENIRRHVSA